jgi:hypothetical protein
MYTTAMSRHDAGRRAIGLTLAAVATLVAPRPAAQGTESRVPIDLALGPDGRPHRAAIAAAADEAVARYTAWLGAAPASAIVIADRSSGDRPPPPATIVISIPWSTAPELMDVESRVAYACATVWWSGIESSRIEPLAEALSWYLQSRVGERLFNLRFGVVAYRTEAVRFFGGSIAWPLPALRLSRWSAGLARDHVLGDSDRAESRGLTTSRVPAGVSQAAVRGALAFGTLERWLGWPVVQGGLRALARQSATTRLSSREAIAYLGAAIGQDVSWLFDAAFDVDRRFDYAIDRVTESQSPELCATESCRRTEVTVARRGAAEFTGSAGAAADRYESGRGLTLRLNFLDGQFADVPWDGRALERTFAVDAPTAANVVSLDPDRAVLLEASPLDLRRAMSPQTNVPLGKWMARWMVWLQDAALAYTTLL